MVVMLTWEVENQALTSWPGLAQSPWTEHVLPLTITWWGYSEVLGLPESSRQDANTNRCSSTEPSFTEAFSPISVE